MQQVLDKYKNGTTGQKHKEPDSHPALNTKKLTRRQFFQRIGQILLIPIAGLWYATTERTKNITPVRTIKIPGDIPEGITFHDMVIVSKTDNKIEVFSSRCTHLGCKINKVENGDMVCPCHGSEFSKNGNVVRGPASKPLKKLPFTINSKTGELTVDVVA